MRHDRNDASLSSAFAPLALALLAACSTPEGTTRVEVDLPEQAKNVAGAAFASTNLHTDRYFTANLVRLSEPVAMHRHVESEEVLYVLSGEGVLHGIDGDRTLEAGDFVVVPRNTPHGFDPTGTSPTVVLQLFVPTFVEGDRIFDDETERP